MRKNSLLKLQVSSSAMNKRAIIFILLAGYIVLTGAVSFSQDINPNGSSELSMLMRKMEKQLKDARPSVINGKYKGVYPKEFDSIFTAKPTDDKTKTANFDVFANIYLNAVKSFVKTPSSQQVDAFNNVVNTCLACHSQHCPGPVGSIKKLLITK